MEVITPSVLSISLEVHRFIPRVTSEGTAATINGSNNNNNNNSNNNKKLPAGGTPTSKNATSTTGVFRPCEVTKTVTLID